LKFLVLGAGKMGKAIAFDLARSDGVTKVILADISLQRLNDVTDWIKSPLIEPVKLNVSDESAVLELMQKVDTTIGCISYKFNLLLSQLAIQAQSNFVDLGGNNTIVQKQFSLHDEATEAGVTIIPDCGLAPGLASILAIAGYKKMDQTEAIHMRVGGLPQNPKPPLNYMIVFSVEGLLNEYIEPSIVIQNGKKKTVESLTEVESIMFAEPFDELEAFHTSGGVSTLANTLEGKLRELDYKTIRYKGHCEKIKTILDIGFRDDKNILTDSCHLSPRKFLETILAQELTFEDEKDVTLLRVEIIGMVDKTKMKIIYEIIDYFDQVNNLTSMMRMTAFPVSIIAQMVTQGVINEHGVLVQEAIIPEKKMIAELTKRGIHVQEKNKKIS
jgi:lysine 6-dehydrogenase